MPTEIRQIAFKSQEAMQAVIEYHRRRSIALPSGSAIDITFDEEPVSAVLRIQAAGGLTKQVPITAEGLAAALILFCINRKIPLPAEADKRLQKLNGGVALIVRIPVKGAATAL